MLWGIRFVRTISRIFSLLFSASLYRDAVSPVEIFFLTIERKFYYSIAKDGDIVK